MVNFNKMDKSASFRSFSPGPLDVYRQNASFNWYELRRFLEGDEILEFKENIWSIFGKDPLFQRRTTGLSMDEQRRLNFARVKRLIEYDFLPEEELVGTPLKGQSMTSIIGSYNWSLLTKTLLHNQVS